MGTNLQKKAQKSFRKHIDSAMEDVSTADLFDETPESCPRQFIAELESQAGPKKGDKIRCEINGNTVQGTKGPNTVFLSQRLPMWVASYIRSKSGITDAIITKVNPFSRTIEVNFCE